MDKNPHLPGTAEDFITKNLNLAHSIAWRFTKWASQKESIKFDSDDFMGIAYIGLIKAYQKFDPTRFTGADGQAIKFSTYAVPVINGEIRRHIRDLGHTIKMSRDGMYTDVDSLDCPLGRSEEGGKIVTLADNIQIDDYATDEQIIINDFIQSVDPRTKKIYELRALGLSQAKVGEIIGLSQVHIARIETKMLELAREYGEQEGGPVKMANSEGIKKMHEEITKSEQFNIIGSAVTIAGQYGVSIPTAYAWKKHLTNAEAMENQTTSVKNHAVETTKSGIVNTSENVDVLNALEIVTEEQDGIVLALEGVGVDDCLKGDKEELETVSTNEQEKTEVGPDWLDDAENKFKCFGRFTHGSVSCLRDYCRKSLACHSATLNLTFAETKDDLEGLVEPEPSWMPIRDEDMDAIERQIETLWKHEAVVKLRNDISKLETEEDDEELLTEIEGWLKGIRERTIERAGKKFDERLSEMIARIS